MKNIILTSLKFLKRILNYSIRNLDKIGPLVMILQIYYWFWSRVHSFFSSWKIIKDMFVELNKLPVFRLFKNILRIFSIISLILNFIILALFANFSILDWIPSIPALSQATAFVYESSPESTQNYINWIALKIKTFILWIWYGLLDIIKRIIKAVIGEMDKDPTGVPAPIEPDKNKYGDIHSKEYMKWLSNLLDEYKFYLIFSFLFFIVGGVAYLYWDSITGCWRPGQDDPDQSGDFPSYNPTEPYGRPRSLPSVSSDSSNSISQFFRHSITSKVSGFKSKVKKFFTAKVPPKPEYIPRGIYTENGRDMWNGLPLPRVETLSNGTEYYFNKDTEGFVKVVTNSFNDTGNVSIINPFSNKAFFVEEISVNERISLINKARANANYLAPDNSFARNPIYEFTQGDIPRPSFGSTSASSSSNLPGTSDGFEDIPLDHAEINPTEALRNIIESAKGKERDFSIPKDINPETGAFGSGSTTPTPSQKLGGFDDFMD